MKSSLYLASAALIAGALSACGSTANASAARPTDTASSTAQSGSEAQCRTKDLRIDVTPQAQAGGYYLITATAKPGVTCTLNGEAAAVAFGSAEDSHAKPVEQAVGTSIELSGEKSAYAGVNPKSANVDSGVLYSQIIVSATADDPDPVSIDLPQDAVVSAPVATNWTAKAGDAVPL